MDVILQGTDLTKQFRDRKGSFPAVDHVDFALHKGEFLGIVGESGCGKSTLLRLAAGLLVPDTGKLFYNGKEYTGAKPAETGKFLQMIFQDAYASFDPRMKMKMSVRETAGTAVSEAHIRRLMDSMGLEYGLLEKRPGELSGGQCQRMSIARGILAGADILLCDEITSALDVVTEAQIVKLLRELVGAEGLSVMFVSHNIALVSQLCSRIIVMYRGRIVEEGSAGRVLEDPADEYTKKLIASCRNQSL